MSEVNCRRPRRRAEVKSLKTERKSEKRHVCRVRGLQIYRLAYVIGSTVRRTDKSYKTHEGVQLTGRLLATGVVTGGTGPGGRGRTQDRGTGANGNRGS